MPYGSLFHTLDWNSRRLARASSAAGSINAHAMAWCFAGSKIAIVEFVSATNSRFHLFAVRHMFLNAEVGHPVIKVQRRAHGNGRQVSGAVKAGAHGV